MKHKAVIIRARNMQDYQAGCRIVSQRGTDGSVVAYTHRNSVTTGDRWERSDVHAQEQCHNGGQMGA